MIRRRGFLLAFSGLGITSLLGWSVLRSKQQDAVITIIYKRLFYLRLDDAGVRRFAHDFVANTKLSGGKLRLVAAFAPIYRRWVLSPDSLLAHAMRFGEERVISRYLLSSDFFTTGADENRVVQYVAFYDPLRACGNPFARPVLEGPPAIEPT